MSLLFCWKKYPLLSLFLLFLNILPFTASAQVDNLSGHDSTIFISNTVFVPKFAYSSGRENWGVDVADFNNDGKLDIVAASNLDNAVVIHLNDGKGDFTNKTAYQSGNSNRAVVAADFNGDGNPDVATVSIKDNALNWHYNNGNGTFGSKNSIMTGLYPHDLAAGDVNGDGKIDIVTVLNSENQFSVHLGKTGGFEAAKKFPTGYKPRSVTIADMNGDGQPDVVVGTDDRKVNIHYNSGGGSFKPKLALNSGSANWGLGVGDFNKDGKLDIATADYNLNQLCIHLTNNKGEYQQAVCIPSGDFNFDLIVGDFDLDKDLDIVTASTRDEMINVHLNDGKGNFSQKKRIDSGNWNAAIAGGDFDGDGDPDIVTASIKDGKINVHRNVTIEPEAEATTGCIYGTLYDKDTKKTLRGVVAIRDQDGNTIKVVQTDANGKYRVCGIPFASRLMIDAKTNGYPKYQETFDFPKDIPKEGLKKDIYFEQIKGTFLYGRVTDIETGEPLPGADIKISDQKGTVLKTLKADASAKYREELPFGTGYQLEVSYPEYNGKSAVVSLYPNNYPKGVERNFELQKIKPKTTACVHGHILEEKTGDKIPGAEVTVMDGDGNIIAKVIADDEGWYEACVPFGKYDIAARKKGYMYKLDTFEVTSNDIDQGVTKDLHLIKFEIGTSIVLENIYYDYNKATLRPESMQELDRLIQIMNENPTLVVEIAGHTDSDGSDAYNQDLSQRRSQSVVDYLLEAGIEYERLVAKGYGESQPIAPNDTPENKQKNRRTEFKVLDF